VTSALNWNCFFAFQPPGTCGDSAPTSPPLAPAPIPAGSITRTRAPALVQAQAQLSPNTPAPMIVTSAFMRPG
jgi:hypothetical protein